VELGLKRNLQIALGLVVSALFIYWALPGLHLPTVMEALQTANYGWLFPGVAVYMVGLGVRTWRWQYILRPVKQVPVKTLFPMVCIGYFGNNVFPFRAGELLRSYVLKRRTNIAITTSLATVIIERVTDGLVMLLFVFLALPFAPMPPFFRNIVVATTALFSLATLLFMWMAIQPERVERFYALLAGAALRGRLRQRADALYERFMLGLRSLRHPSDVIMIFFTSVLIWLLETVKYWFVMHAFDFSVSFVVLMLMNGLVNLATTLPAAPGYIGTFDAPGIKTLEAFGVNASVAASYTFTLHAALWAPVTLLGGYYFWREHLRLSDIEAAQRQAEAASAPAEASESEKSADSSAQIFCAKK
jgi:uncharacterized protein (TIRG00374 family)